MAERKVHLITSRTTVERELKDRYEIKAPERIPSRLIPLWQASMLIGHYLADEEMQQRVPWRIAAQFLCNQIDAAIEREQKTS